MARRTVAQVDRELQNTKAQLAMVVNVLKLVLEGRWVGEMPTAEAFVKALDPSDTAWSAVDFFKPAR